MSDAGASTRFTKASVVSIEILITVILLTAFIIGSIIRSEMNNADNQHDIAQMSGTLSAYKQTSIEQFDTINSTLRELLYEFRLRNRIAQMQVNNVWTAGMMDEWQEKFIITLLKATPSIIVIEKPDIEKIRKKQLERTYGDASDSLASEIKVPK